MIVIPFILTDFQVLAPDIPVRLGASAHYWSSPRC